MPRHTLQDARKLGEIKNALSDVRLGAAPAMASVVPALGDLLGTEKTAFYSLVEKGETVEVDAIFASQPDLLRFRDEVNACPAAQRSRTFSYDPLRPAAAQRNAVLTLDDLRALGETPGRSRRSAPVQGKMGIATLEHLRVLLCEGPAMLGYVGALQPEPFVPRQRRLLRHLVPALGARLALERRAGSADWSLAALDAAMNTIASPAFVVSDGLTILHANEAGRAQLDRSKQDVLRALEESLRAPPGTYAMTRLSSDSSRDMHLGVARAVTEPAIARLRHLARQWELSQRQVAVLELIAQGEANKTIAARLEISLRTVEVHVTALFARAGVESRAALVAKFWRGH